MQNIISTNREPYFGTKGTARPELYHCLTENRFKTALALCFTEWVIIPEAHTPIPSPIPIPIPQSTCDASGVACSWAPLTAYHQPTSARFPPVPKSKCNWPESFFTLDYLSKCYNFPAIGFIPEKTEYNQGTVTFILIFSSAVSRNPICQKSYHSCLYKSTWS